MSGVAAGAQGAETARGQVSQLAAQPGGCACPLSWHACAAASLPTPWRPRGIRADDPLVASIAQQYLTDREAHDRTATEWAKRYASA